LIAQINFINQVWIKLKEQQKHTNYFLKPKDLILQTILLTKHFNFIIMARTRKRTCAVTGITTSENNFYGNQTHVKAVDNLRRVTGANRQQLRRMFNQLATY